VLHTLATLAEVRGIEPSVLAEEIDANAARVFALP
jgi:Tat protein secretion system quality control protein TatD with DNase activity